MRARARAALVLLALSACQSETPTGLVVEVTSNLQVPAEQEFHLRVSASDGRLLRDLAFHAADLPARLSLVPESSAATTVTVEAIAPVKPTLSRRAIVAFRPGSLLLLRLPLEARCVCKTCSGGQTCKGGDCADELEDPAKLPAYAPRVTSDGSKVAVPVCGGDAGPRPSDGGDAAPMVPTDAAAADGAIPPDVANVPPDGGWPDAPPGAERPPPDAPSMPDLAVLPPDAPAAPDLPHDMKAPAPDVPVDVVALPPDSAPPPDLTTARAEGEACNTSDQCLSHACVDHVCCRNACAGACMACDNVHTGAPSGQCAPVLAGNDPDGDCTGDMPMTCGYDGLCNGAGACRFYPATTQCAAATCGGSTFTPARNCTGAGACSAPAPQDCGLFFCTPTGCPVTCQSQGACTSSAYCNGSACVPKKAALQPCAQGYECVSNNCGLVGLALVCI